MPPWAPYPGASSGPLMSRDSPVSPMVAPTTAPKEPERLGAVVEARAARRGRGRRRCRSSAPVACWTSGPSLLEVRASTNTPAPCLRAVSIIGVERAEAEERAGGDRVGGQRRGRVEVGVGVGLRGGADVAALHVEQHQRAGRPGLGDHPLQDRDPAAAEPLVERRLRLDDRDERRHRLDHGEREPSRARPRRRRAPSVQQRRRAGRCRRRAGRGRGGRRGGGLRTATGHAVVLELGRRGGWRWWGRAAARCRPGRRWRPAARNDAHVVGVVDAAAADDLGLRAPRRAPRRRSAARAAGSAGPLSPPGRPSGIAAGRALPTTTAPAPASRTVRALSTTRTTSERSFASTGMPRGRSRWTADDHAGGVERLADVEDAGAGRVGGGEVHLDPGDPGRPAQPPGQLGVLPQRLAGDRHEHARTLLHQPGQLGGEEVVDAGVLQADRVDAARTGSPRSAARGRPGRALTVIERVTKPPSAARAPYAASSRPVPPQPDGDQDRVGQGEPGELEQSHSEPSLEVGPARPGRRGTPGRRCRRGPSGRSPSSPTTGTAQPWHRPVPQVIGCSRAVWLQAPASSAAAATACSVAGRPGGVDDLGLRLGQHLGEHVGHRAPAADRPVAGDDGDRAGRAARLERGQQVRLVVAGDDQGDGAVALAEPLGEREQRRGGVPLADEDAADRLLGQGERTAERSGDLEPRPGGRPASQRVPGPTGSTTSSMVAP